ncbi:DUF6894 family protein [Methylobacterium radiotolerans]|uniref:DUF6894 family protein n=1 Tax=Methylobacterium radiotolerans TaxID=31998 RepID=UPI00097723DE|nr:hypothetical protein [Methylobacterium radiotolerans]ONF49439.1 hypothetical protein RSM1_09200 [Methylobacterium radiotolerans]
MTRFRFLMTEGDTDFETEPIDLASLDEAKAHAVELVAQHLRDANGSFWQGGDWRLDVMDDRGLILATLLVHGFDAAAGDRF